MVYIVGILLLLTLVVLTAGVMVSRRGDTATQQRLGQFVGGLSTDKSDEKKEKKAQGPSALTESLERVIEQRGLGGDDRL